MTDKDEARQSSIAKFSRGSRRSNPGFSKSKDIDVASISEIGDSSIFKRVKKRANVSVLVVWASLHLVSASLNLALRASVLYCFINL